MLSFGTHGKILHTFCQDFVLLLSIKTLFSFFFYYYYFRVNAKFWNTWKDFEVRHGNEDTLREMLRIKRSVEHQYNTQVNMMSAQMLSGKDCLAFFAHFEFKNPALIWFLRHHAYHA